jgi:hypothetical protein
VPHIAPNPPTRPKVSAKCRHKSVNARFVGTAFSPFSAKARFWPVCVDTFGVSTFATDSPPDRSPPRPPPTPSPTGRDDSTGRETPPRADHGGGAGGADGSTGRGGPLPPPRCTRRPARATAPGDCPRCAAPLRPPLAGSGPRCAPRATAGGRAASPAHGNRTGSRPPPQGLGRTAPRLPPSQTTAPRRRGPRLPGEHSPGDSPSPAILQPRRPIRHDLLDPPPSFQVLSPNPSLPAYGDPAPKLAGLISSPVRTHIGERPRKEGGGRRFIHVHSFAAPKRGQEVGQIRTAAIRRSPPQPEQPRRETPAPGLPTLGAGCAGPAVAGTVREAPQAPPSRPARLGSTFSRTRSQAAPSGPALGLCPSPPRRPRGGPRRASAPNQP